MADIKQLDSIIQIDGEDYEVIAETAKKVLNKLTINTKVGSTTTKTEFDGSEAKELTIDLGQAGGAEKIQVITDSGNKYATITISKNEPTGGVVGDIWFKY
jgi:hypothetical protein